LSAAGIGRLKIPAAKISTDYFCYMERRRSAALPLWEEDADGGRGWGMAGGPIGGWVEVRLPTPAEITAAYLLDAAITKQDVSSAIFVIVRMYL